jgi:hypothetical protein
MPVSSISASAVRVLLAIGLLGSSQAAHAQWIHVPLPGTPRTGDGKPNLSAPAPKTADGKPDLTGVWRRNEQPDFLTNIAVELPNGAPLRPEAAALMKSRQENLRIDEPTAYCLPPGVLKGVLLTNLPFKIVQAPHQLVLLYEEFNQFRQVFTDGREFPVERTPTWWGYSVGHWEGDTLVVEAVGFNDRTWLDLSGTPHSDAFHLTERYRRLDFGHLEIQFTFDDVKFYTRPWSATVRFELVADSELIEYVCENEKDVVHLRVK